MKIIFSLVFSLFCFISMFFGYSTVVSAQPVVQVTASIQVVELGSAGEASTFSVNGEIVGGETDCTLSFTVNFGDSSSQFLNGPGIVSHVYSSPGSYTLSVVGRACDIFSRPFYLTVNIQDPPGVDSPPQINVQRDYKAFIGQPVRITGTATDSDGDVVKVFIELVGSPGQFEEVGPSFLVNRVFKSAGIYNLTIRAEDSGGLSTSQNLRFVVRSRSMGLIFSD